MVLKEKFSYQKNHKSVQFNVHNFLDRLILASKNPSSTFYYEFT